MFKKVQLKFFIFISTILIAIIIAVLVSINLIMNAVVQRQSKVVLKQIATSVEYDDETSTFVYFEDDKPDHEPDDELPPKDEKKENGTSEDTTADEDDEEETTSDLTEEESGESETSEKQTDAPAKEAPTNQKQTEAAVTTAQSSKTEEQTKTVTTTKSAQTTAAATTKAAQQTTTQAATEPILELTTGYQGPPNIDDRHFDDGNNPDDYIYPETEDWEKWNSYSNSLDTYSYDWDVDDEDEESDESSGTDVYVYVTPESDDYDTDSEDADNEDTDSDDTGIMLLSGNMASPLDGFTIVAAAVESAPDPDLKEGGETVPKSLGSIDFFVVMADKDGNYLASLNNEELTEATAQSYITRILKSDEESGLLDKLQYYTLEKENGTIMVFTDKSAELDTLDQLTRTTILIGVISMIVLSILTLFISKKSIQPIKTAFEKQKQFISDASHELKTPLTIISANADVLSDEIGDNKWLDYIKSQADRMNVLVNDLLNLTRLENNTSDFICAKFNLSKAIENTALPFECQAFEQNKVFDIDIQDELYITGSERHIKQMAAIFIDNALKYSDEGGTVRITLRAQGDKKILSVFNTGSGVREDEKDKIFERFYRSDDSRARTTGGYGLGLSIAKSIIDKHKFKVTVDNDEGSSICFNVTM